MSGVHPLGSLQADAAKHAADMTAHWHECGALEFRARPEYFEFRHAHRGRSSGWRVVSNLDERGLPPGATDAMVRRSWELAGRISGLGRALNGRRNVVY